MTDLVARIATWFGVCRSLIMYWRPGYQRHLCHFYRSMVTPGDLVFDVGAHLGDRAVAFSTLGARVIALEPQPQIVPWLRRLVRRHDRITIRAEAVGRTPGHASLAISRRTPTLSTLATTWRQTLPTVNQSFRHVRWEEHGVVQVVTLDQLISLYGVPQFCKIDVEGYEAEVLAGVTQPLPQVSIEFVQGGLDVALSCLQRLTELGVYEFNAVSGEERRFLFDGWLTRDRMTAWLQSGASNLSSGDLYARLLSTPAHDTQDHSRINRT